MEYSKKTTNLEKGDMDKIIKLRNKFPRFLVFLNVVIISVLLIAFIGRGESVGFLFIFVLMMIGVSYAIFKFVDKQYLPFVRDYKAGKKLIISSKIEDKKFRYLPRGYSMYYLVVAGRNLKIDINRYSDFEIGDTVIVEIGPTSNYLIKIQKV